MICVIWAVAGVCSRRSFRPYQGSERRTCDGGLVKRLERLVQGCQPRAPHASAQLSLALQRQSYDWLALDAPVGAKLRAG